MGTTLPKNKFNYTQEGIQSMSGNLNHMNMLITLSNKMIDVLDIKISPPSEDNGKCKEPPRFEKSATKMAKTKDDNI